MKQFPGTLIEFCAKHRLKRISLIINSIDTDIKTFFYLKTKSTFDSHVFNNKHGQIQVNSSNIKICIGSQIS